MYKRIFPLSRGCFPFTSWLRDGSNRPASPFAMPKLPIRGLRDGNGGRKLYADTQSADPAASPPRFPDPRHRSFAMTTLPVPADPRLAALVDRAEADRLAALGHLLRRLIGRAM